MNRRLLDRTSLPISEVCIATMGFVLLLANTLNASVPKNETWSATPIGVVPNLEMPECMLPDLENEVVYISNMETETEGFWEDDNKGFISRMTRDGTMQALRWKDSTPASVIHSPKGMAIFNGYLYFNDNTRLLRFRINTNGSLEQIKLPETKKLNDLATDGKHLWVSDTEAGKVYCVSPEKNSVREIPAPASINGLACFQGRLYGVSWDLHELFELDPQGLKEPQPFGLADHFVKLDAIEVLPDGTFIVSDCFGNKLCSISSDRKSVCILATLDKPTDMGIDRKHHLLYVPQLFAHQAVIYQLKNETKVVVHPPPKS